MLVNTMVSIDRYRKFMFHYNWRAKFKDGDVVNQAKEGEDSCFRRIAKSKKPLKSVELISTDGQDRVYSVDMETGDMNLNGLIVKSVIEIGKYKASPIFWRRNRVYLFSQDKTQEIIGYILGWQVNISGKNRKQQFMITPSGEVITMNKADSQEISARGKIVNLK